MRGAKRKPFARMEAEPMSERNKQLLFEGFQRLSLSILTGHVSALLIAGIITDKGAERLNKKIKQKNPINRL